MPHLPPINDGKWRVYFNEKEKIPDFQQCEWRGKGETLLGIPTFPSEIIA